MLRLKNPVVLAVQSSRASSSKKKRGWTGEGALKGRRAFEGGRETQTGEASHVNLEGFKEEGGWGAGGVHWHVDMGGSKGGGA